MFLHQVKFSSLLVVVKGCAHKQGVKMYEFRLSTIAFENHFISNSNLCNIEFMLNTPTNHTLKVFIMLLHQRGVSKVWYPTLPVQTPSADDRLMFVMFFYSVAGFKARVFGAAGFLKKHNAQASLNSCILNAYKTGFANELE